MSSVTVKNCTSYKTGMSGNGGGAVMVSNSASASLTSCEFKNNSAPYGTSTLTVKDSTFSGNSSANGGNDIYIFDGATEGKSGAYSDSKVSYTLTGNTYGTYTDGDTEYKKTAVMMGRYYTTITTTDRNGNEVTKDHVGSDADFPCVCGSAF